MSGSVVLDGVTLSPAAVARAAREDALVEVTSEAIGRNRAAYETSLRRAAEGARIYGMTTGVGALRSTAIDARAQDDYQRRILRSHAAGAGEPERDETVRAMMLVRANQLGAGGAGVHPSLFAALVDALHARTLPDVRSLGSVGTGDLAALASVALVLLGERAPRSGPAVEPATLGPRDGLAFLSSNARAVAEAALACHDLAGLVADADACAALSFEAAAADPIVLDPGVHASRPHDAQQRSAERIRTALDGYVAPGTRVQDSFAFRCVAQVHGVLIEAHATLDRVVRVELNAAGENPVVVGDRVLPNGNFHAAMLASALDHARNAVARVGSLSAARLADLLDGSVTGLAPFLAHEAGADSGLMALEYTARDASCELIALATPTLAGASISHGVENDVSGAALAARHASRAVDRLRIVLAAELLAAVRALRLRGGPRGRGTRDVFSRIAAAVDADPRDRPLEADLDAAVALARSGALR